MDDVDEFEGHIACDAVTRSEIVVPILVDGEVSSPSRAIVLQWLVWYSCLSRERLTLWGWLKVVAIIDVDCKTLAGFDEVDEKELESLACLLAKSCDWK